MTASELNRKLIYCGCEDIVDYLRNSPLNRHMYKTFLEMKERYDISVPVVSLMNEVYYQCARVNYDNQPGVDISKRYLDESAAWLDSRPAAGIVFSIVWALLKSRVNQTFQEECFIEKLEPIVQGFEYNRVAADESHYLSVEGIFFPDVFPTKPCPLNDILVSEGERLTSGKSFFSELFGPSAITSKETLGISLKIITDNYTHSAIERYVRIYPEPMDQVSLIKMLLETMPSNERHKHKNYLERLQDRIALAQPWTDDGAAVVCERDLGYVPREDLWDEPLSPNEDTDEENEYKKECERLKEELKARQEEFDREIAALEAKHKEETENLKEMLRLQIQQMESEKDRKEDTHETRPKDALSFTLTELVALAKENLGVEGAKDFCYMLSGYIVKQRDMDEKVWTLIESVIPAVEQRVAPRNNFDIRTVHQMNVNPQQVINNTKKEK